MVTGNEALALGALHAGVKVVTGYPGTPSTRALASLLAMNLADRHVEWSTNEKVALEIASAAAWANQRALCTMKMSGLNVAYDSLISIAYSGCSGGLVIYVADDPGVSAGMAEQDSRTFALMADLPMLEPATVAETYRLTRLAFELSEQTGTPVFIRLVTALANTRTAIELAEPLPLPERPPLMVRDINRYTKAGAAICMAQHRDLIARLDRAGEWIAAQGLNTLTLAPEPGGIGLLAAGITAAYLPEALARAADLGLPTAGLSILSLSAVHPFPEAQVKALLDHCRTVIILEELEPVLEKSLYVTARRAGFTGRIIGKLDGTFERIGEYGLPHILRGLSVALDREFPAAELQGHAADTFAAPRPITVCAGCPHRGTFMAINQALKKLKYKKDEVMVTGDIGCTILGMNPPFHTVWNEVSMGASIGMAQGYVRAGVQTPVIATMGDSTFFHAGIPGLINAVQHQTPLTLIIMDNGWTCMTGMQVNPGTVPDFQKAGHHRVDIAAIVPALGVDHFVVVDPYHQSEMVAALQQAIPLPGVKVILARQECAIQAQRRGLRAGKTAVVAEKCVRCKLCITITGCPALILGEKTVSIDPTLCYGCGLCAGVCNLDAMVHTPLEEDKEEVSA